MNKTDVDFSRQLYHDFEKAFGPFYYPKRFLKNRNISVRNAVLFYMERNPDFFRSELSSISLTMDEYLRRMRVVDIAKEDEYIFPADLLMVRAACGFLDVKVIVKMPQGEHLIIDPFTQNRGTVIFSFGPSFFRLQSITKKETKPNGGKRARLPCCPAKRRRIDDCENDGT
jgi:hypothetical protein